MPQFKRNIIFHTNKYQRRILIPVLGCAFLACNLALMCLAYFYYSENKGKIFNVSFEQFKFFVPWFVIGASCLLLFFLLWTYYISNKMVGPFHRVIKELDDILETKSKKRIMTRPGDELFEELLKRINTLVDRLP